MAEAAAPPRNLLIQGPDGQCVPAWTAPNKHRIFVGDNLDVLKHLATSPLRFHFIYTDPPYNTGRQFTYSDSHGSTPQTAQEAWLSMVWPRFKLAHSVLRPDGVLFVSIDDHEVAALTLVLREIFGDENHIGTLKWRRKRKPSFLDRHLGTVLEYVLVFTRDHRKFRRLKGKIAKEITRPVLNAANPVATRILRAGTAAHCRDGNYPPGVRRNRTLEVFFPQGLCIQQGRVVQDVPMEGRFRVSQDILDRTVFVTRNGGLRRHVAPDERSYQHASDDCTDWPTNEDAEREIRAIFGHRAFDYPKPVGLLENLLDMCQNQTPGEPYLCLDFFAGSAPLAEAVARWSEKTSHSGVCHLIQSPEPCSTSNGFRTIADLTISRAQRALEAAAGALPLEVIHFNPSD